MVEAVTARRLAGDWHGACAAGLVDVEIDLREVAARYGGDEAARIEADLLGFAPDLLQRFAPRNDDLALAPGQRIVLSRLAVEFPQLRRRRLGAPILLAMLPQREGGRQRIALRVSSTNELAAGWYDLPDWCWHADAVDARRWAYGASPDRLPWHTADGRPYRQGESTASDQPADRAAQVETITALLEAQQVTEAYDAAGVAIGSTGETDWERRSFGRWLAALGPTLPVLAAEARRLAHRYGRSSLYPVPSIGVAIDVAGGGGLTVRATGWHGKRGGPAAFGVRAPVDVALLRWGSLAADELHPLVHEALLPRRVQRWRAPVPAPRPAFRVRCGPDWHSVRVAGGKLLTPQHTDAEIGRELLLAGLGGPITGCAAALRAWRTGAKPVPKEVRKIRRGLFSIAFHGDTDTLLTLLAEGIDPGLRDGRGNSLMHYLHHLEHARALPFFIAAGVPVDARNADGLTPLHAAALCAAAEVMDALIAAGADPAAVSPLGRTPAEVLAQVRKQAER